MQLPNELKQALDIFDSKYPKLSNRKEACFKFNGEWTVMVEHDLKKIDEPCLFAINVSKKKIQPFTVNPTVVGVLFDELDHGEYINLKSDDHLEHHGIKGQKWGVKNGPPYPLADNNHTTFEKKAGIAEELIVPATYLAVFAAAAVAARVSAKKADERRTVQYDEEYYQNRSIKTLAECPKIDPDSMSMDDHMKAINPDYPDMGSTQNCMFCTTAMAMRMKGYDVQAEKCPDGWSAKNLQNTWKDMKVETPKMSSTAKISDFLKEQGDGAYGNLIVYWATGGGHSVFYKVDNGQVKIYDTQSNKERKMRDLSGLIIPRSTEVIRLDNKEPTEMALGAVKRKEDKT